MFVFLILRKKMSASYNSYVRTKGAQANNKELIALLNKFISKYCLIKKTNKRLIFNCSIVRLYVHLGSYYMIAEDFFSCVTCFHK